MPNSEVSNIEERQKLYKMALHSSHNNRKYTLRVT